MNKRDSVLSLLDSGKPTTYIPAAFFLHFDPAYHRGQAAIEKHLEYFRFTGMDFVKIQYEARYPLIPQMQRAKDWVKMPCYGDDFYQDQWNIAKGLVETAGKDALVVMTLYSPLMCAGHTIGKENLIPHFEDDPEKVKVGLETITESLLTFARGCIEAGIDGFYHSTQGGETHRFEGSPIFEEYIKPYDLALMEEIEQKCEFNILHVCDYEGGYSSYEPFVDYPGHIVNASLYLADRTLTGKEIAEMFKRPFMGGMDRHGIIVTGTKDEIQNAVTAVCENASDKLILGADCTLPSNIPWENIKTAIQTGHTFRT